MTLEVITNREYIGKIHETQGKYAKYMSKKSRNVIFPEKKAPAGGRTTDKGFIYIQ